MTTKRVTLTNTADGARTYYAMNKQRVIRRGETHTAVEMTEAEYKNIMEMKASPNGTVELRPQVVEAGKGPGGAGIAGAEAFDHDNDGKVGGSKKKPKVLTAEEAEAMTVAELREFLDKRGDKGASDALKADLIAQATAEPVAA